MIVCPLCHSANTKFSFTSQNRHGRHLLDTKNKFKVYQCLSCQTTFLNKIKVDSSYYSQFYPQNYYPDSISFFTKLYQKLFTTNNSSQLQNLFKKNQKLRILDIGCGDGQFLSSLSDNFSKHGLDTSQNSVKICQSKNIYAQKADITTSVPFKKKFDLITLNHVFEHLASPSSALKNIHPMLNSSGFLLLTVPLSDSLGLKLGRKFWFHLDSPRHLFIPSLSGLNTILKENNFKVIKTSRNPFEFPLDIFWSIKNNPVYWPLFFIYPFLKLLDRETITFICQKN